MSQQQRFPQTVLAHVHSFVPWWVECERCHKLAYLRPDFRMRLGEVSCHSCGASYRSKLADDYLKTYTSQPLWYKADFRGETFFALNRQHLEYLETVISATLRERTHRSQSFRETPDPKKNQRTRLKFTRLMPYNLPAWMLSAKNRGDLLKLIARLKSK